MGMYDELTLENLLSPESAAIARKVGTEKIAPVGLEALETEALRDFADFWNKARDGMPLPCVSRLDPVEIPRHLSQAILIDVKHDPLAFQFRLVGDGPVQAYGYSTAGMNVMDLEVDGVPVGKMMYEAYAWIAAQRNIVAMKGPNAALADGYKRQEMVYLPFSDGGSRIVRILGAAVYYR